jgi:hypothetical protein
VDGVDTVDRVDKARAQPAALAKPEQNRPGLRTRAALHGCSPRALRLLTILSA